MKANIYHALNINLHATECYFKFILNLFKLVLKDCKVLYKDQHTTRKRFLHNVTNFVIYWMEGRNVLGYDRIKKDTCKIYADIPS